MASLFRKPGSPYFFAAFRDPLGRRVQRSTKQSNRSAALRVLVEWDKLAAHGRAGTLTEVQARKVAGEILRASTGEDLHFHSFRAWTDEWLAGKRATVGAKSIEKYGQVIGDFLAHLGDRAELSLAAIGPRDVRTFRDALTAGGRAPSTVNQTIRKVLTAPFGAAMRLGYLTMNPCASVEALPDDDDAQRETFTPAQMKALLSEAEGDWKGAILTGYFTGLRCGDVANLLWESVDMEAGVLRVRTGKTKAKVVVPIHAELSRWLRAQTRGIAKAPVFPALAGKGTGGRYGLSGRFRAIMDRAGVKGRILRGADGKGRQTSTLSFHSLRHTFISALANAGVAEEIRKRLCGHAHGGVHGDYTHHEITVLRAAVGKLPGIGKVAA